MANFGDFLGPAFPAASRVQHISDLHSRRRPHHVWKYGRSNLRLLRLGEETRNKEEETIGQIYNVRICYAGRP